MKPSYLNSDQIHVWFAAETRPDKYSFDGYDTAHGWIYTKINSLLARGASPGTRVSVLILGRGGKVKFELPLGEWPEFTPGALHYLHRPEHYQEAHAGSPPCSARSYMATKQGHTSSSPADPFTEYWRAAEGRGREKAN